MGWVFDVASLGRIAGSMSSSDSLTGNINAEVVEQAAVTWFNLNTCLQNLHRSCVLTAGLCFMDWPSK